MDRLNQVWPVLGLESPGLDLELNAGGQMCLLGGADSNMAWHLEPMVMMGIFGHASTL